MESGIYAGVSASKIRQKLHHHYFTTYDDNKEGYLMMQAT